MDGLIMVLPAHEFTFAFDRSMSAAVSPAALTPDNPSLGFKLFRPFNCEVQQTG